MTITLSLRFPDILEESGLLCAATAATIPFIEAAKDNFHISSRNFCCVHCISRTIETRWLYIYVVVW